MRELPRLYKLDSGQILEVVRDLHYFSLGYNIIIVPDAYELFDYCFPINPIDENKDIDPETLAESQAALNYLFKADELDRPPVVMLDEYRDELRGLMDAIFGKSDAAYDNALMIKKMIEIVGLENIAGQQAAELEAVVQKHFQFLLAVLLGIHSLGVSRMNQAYARGLTPIFAAIKPEDRSAFRAIWGRYKHSRLHGIIFNALEDYNAKRGIKATQRTERANRNDAAVIDRLIYLNREVDRSFNGQLLKNKYLFLYISSPQKSAMVFKLPAVKSALPEVMGRRYPFWRNRHQVLAYVVHRSRGADARENILETVKALRSLAARVKRVEEFEKVLNSESQGCRRCVLDDKTPDSCALLNYCRDVQATANRIKEKSEEVTNWGLFQQASSSYRYLREAQVADLGHRILIQLFADIIESSKLRDIALERMYQRHLWIYRASEWTILTNRIKEGFDPTKEIDLRTETDRVTGVDQHLPCKPIFRSDAYKEIIALILQFYRTPKRVDLFDEAYRKFVNLEAVAKQDDEYDLLRGYLYLAFSFEENVHSYVRDILLPKIKDGTSEHAKRESLYVLCWSARRAGLFAEADGYALRGSEQTPDDPRFLHGRALNIYAWATHNPRACPYPLTDALSAAERALELFKRNEAENVDLIAACHNVVAYLLALDAKTGGHYGRPGRARKLETARQHVEQLKRLVDKKTGWNPVHPEYFHTEAFLEYQLVQHYRIGRERTKDQLMTTLKSARKDIKTAIDIFERRRYRELKDEIDQLLALIRSDY